MKILNVCIGFLFLLGIISWNTNNPDCKNSTYILGQTKKQYDADKRWEASEIKLHIQEPRVGNPLRHTKLQLVNSTDYFEMERFREDGVVKRILTGDGESKIFLNNETDLPEDIIETYRLNKERSIGHKNFYKLMYGLPMSLNETLWEQIAPAEKGTFEGSEVYRVNVALKEAMISKHWTLLIDVKNYKLLGIEFNHPEAPGKEEELIKFESEFEVDGIKLPRIRNWYIKGTNEYLGSDIILETLK
ncbi:MAG: DUF6503 family protein [Flavobacteriaceae bacterium]